MATLAGDGEHLQSASTSDNSGPSLLQLPTETLCLITSCLSNKSALRFSSTCEVIRQAVKPLIFRHIYFDGIHTSAALRSLSTFESKDLRLVKRITILVTRDTIPLDANRPREAKRAWNHVLNCMPELGIVRFNAFKNLGQPTTRFIAGLFKAPIWDLARETFAASSSRPLSFEVKIENADGSRPSVDLHEFETVLKFVARLPRTTLLMHALEPGPVGDPERCLAIIQRVLQSGINLQTSADGVLGRHYKSRPLCSTFVPLQHLCLQGLVLDVNTTLTLLSAARNTLETADFTISAGSRLIPIGNINRVHMALLTHLSISCPNDPDPDPGDLHGDPEQAFLKLLQAMQTPVLEVLDLSDSPGLSEFLRHSAGVLRFLHAAPKIRSVYATWRTARQEPLKKVLNEWESLCEDLYKRGTEICLDISGLAYKYSGGGQSSVFRTWLPWSSPLYYGLDRLSLHISGKLPIDLHVAGEIAFFNLQYLSILLIEVDPIHALANVFNQLRLPACRNLRIYISSSPAAPLRWSIVSKIPYMLSLETLEITTVDSFVEDDIRIQLSRICQARDIDFVFVKM